MRRIRKDSPELNVPTDEKPAYLAILEQEFSKAMRKNPRFSLRSFARMLQIDAAALSKILAMKKLPSATNSEKMVTRLNLSEYKTQKFFDSLSQEKTHKSKAKLNQMQPKRLLRDIVDQDFEGIHDLLHFSILELTFLQDFEPKIPWMAEKLGRPIFEVRRAVDRLMELSLLETNAGTMQKACERIFVNKGVNRVSGKQIRNHLKQVFDYLGKSIHDFDPSVRVATSFTVPANPARIAEARKMIEEFSLELTRFLADGEITAVYQFGIGLAPLTNPLISQRAGTQT